MERPTMHADGIHKMDYGAIDGAPMLAVAYQSRERVEITWTNEYGGGTVRGYVGKTTGWTPCYLLLLRRNSAGGSTLLYGSNIAKVRGLGVYRR